MFALLFAFNMNVYFFCQLIVGYFCAHFHSILNTLTADTADTVDTANTANASDKENTTDKENTADKENTSDTADASDKENTTDTTDASDEIVLVVLVVRARFPFKETEQRLLL